jgi:hypothetical protein
MEQEPGVEVPLTGSQTRRDLLKKAGVGVAVMWTAPMVMSFATPAAAGSVGGGGTNCPGCGRNLLLNGSFESGKTDWVFTGLGTVYPYTLTPSVVPIPGSGSFFGADQGSGLGTGVSIEQTVAVDPACAGFSFTLDHQHWVIGTETLTISFVGSGQPDTVLTYTDVGGWNGTTVNMVQAASVIGTIPSGTTQISIAFAAYPGASDLGVDEVSFIISC